MDLNTYIESIIPRFVWDFVKKTLKNPIAQGILALMIANYIRRNKKESESDKEFFECFLEDNTMGNSGVITTSKLPKGQTKFKLWTVKLLDTDDKVVSITVDAKDESAAKKIAKKLADKKFKKQFQVKSVRKVSWQEAFDNLYCEAVSDLDLTPPKSAQNNAKKALKWRDEHPDDTKDAGTRIGWTRANQLANGEQLSVDVVKHMASFNRHRKNAKVNADYKDEPWKDNGYLMWLAWGGDTGIDWAIRMSDRIDNKKESVSQASESNNDEWVDTTKNPEQPSFYNKKRKILYHVKKKPVDNKGSYVYIVMKNGKKLFSYDNIRDAKKSIARAINKGWRECLEELYKETSFNTQQFVRAADKLKSLDEVTRWVRKNNLAKHGHCQSIAALYGDIDGSSKVLSAPGHVAFLKGNMVYDPIKFDEVPISVEQWKALFPNNKESTAIKLR